jgi:ABC-type ATPase involved in cell division
MPSVRLGRDCVTGQEVRVGDVERRSGLYVLGKPGMGKSALMVNMMLGDSANGHGLVFLDPHGDAITDLAIRLPERKLGRVPGRCG